MNWLLSLVLFLLPPGVRTQIPEEIRLELKLPESVANTYEVYNFEAYKELRLYGLAAEEAAEKVHLLDSKLKNREEAVEAISARLLLAEQKASIFEDRSERRLDSLITCRTELDKPKSVIPVVMLATGITTLATGIVLFILR